MNLFKNIVFCFVILFFSACNSNNNTVNSHLFNRDSFQTLRLDRSIFQLDTNHLSAGLMQLNKQYPAFLPFYLCFKSNQSNATEKTRFQIQFSSIFICKIRNGRIPSSSTSFLPSLSDYCNVPKGRSSSI